MATNPPCFAFVNFKHRNDAEDAIQAMDGKWVDDWINYFDLLILFVLEWLIILELEFRLHVNVQSVVVVVVVVVVGVVHLVMEVIAIHVEIMIHREIVVGIHHDHRMIRVIEIVLDEDDILDHVVQFNIINVIIVHDQDQDHQNVVIDKHQEIDHHNNKQQMLFIDMKKVMINDLNQIDFLFFFPLEICKQDIIQFHHQFLCCLFFFV
jgi:hypothetical protein